MPWPRRSSRSEDPHALIEAFVDELGERWRNDWRELPSWQAIAVASEPTRKAVVIELLRHTRGRVRGTRYEFLDAVAMWGTAIDQLSPAPSLWGARPLLIAWTPDDLTTLVQDATDGLEEARICAHVFHADRWVAFARHSDLADPQLRQALRELAASLQRNFVDRETHSTHRNLYTSIAEMLGEPELIRPDAWARALTRAGSGVDAQLLALATAAPAKPTARLAKRRAALVEHLGATTAREHALALLRTAAAARPEADEPPIMTAATASLLTGLVHIATGFASDDTAVAIADLGIAAYRKVPHFGACSGKLGTVCARALADRPDALPQLARMQQRTSHPPSKAKLDKLLEEVAQRLGVTHAELTEIVVPDFGLDGDGALQRGVGDAFFRLAVARETVSPSWISAAGKVAKTPPVAVRQAHPEAVAEVKALTKSVRDAFGVQRARVETLLREDREWPLHAWQARYPEHGLVGPLARGLVWRIADDAGERSAVWHAGRLLDVHGAPLPTLGEATRVRPWHPAGALPGEVAAWRERLAALGIEQPFAQVQRDVFAPDADDRRAQAVVRFRGLRLRQHQLAAILKARGWRYELRSAAWDSDDDPTLQLRSVGLTATLGLAPSRTDEPASERSIVLAVTCEELVFGARGARVSPADIPLVVFSEVVRDVALVASAAAEEADPAQR